MLREAYNVVQIDGILNEIRLSESSYTRDGVTHEYIGGSIVVKVPQVIDGDEIECLIPVYVFANKYSKGNNTEVTASYKNMKEVMTEYVSVAASDEEHADRVRISRGRLTMNDYYGRNGTLYSEPRITTAFVSRVPKTATSWAPKALFEVEFTLVDKQEELDANGLATGRLKLKAAVPRYGEKVDLFSFIVQNKKAVEIISKYWEVEKTYRPNGLFNFSTKVEEYFEEQDYDFGDPVKKTRTNTVREILICGGSRQSLDSEQSFDIEDIKKGLVERKAAIEARKEQDMAKAKAKAAPAPATSEVNAFADLGF